MNGKHLALFLVLIAAEAQSFECPVPVRYLASTSESLKGNIAAADVDIRKNKLILYDPAISTLPKIFQDHIWAHECAHHTLGHLGRRHTYNSNGEYDADCEAVKLLKWSITEVDELIEVWKNHLPESIHTDRSTKLRSCVNK